MKSSSLRITANLMTFIIFAALLLQAMGMILLGLWPNKSILIGAAAIMMVFALLRVGSCRWKLSKQFFTRRQRIPPEKTEIQIHEVDASPPPTARKPADPNDIDALVAQMLDQGRFALLMRSQIAENLSDAHFCRALRALEDSMALVPDGDVQLDEGELSRIVTVHRFFLDRYPVTNRQFFEFVAAGGYEQSTLWVEDVLPAVLDFVDRSGNPGPKYWQNGCYPPGEEKHPVVGVSWYEAAAYARWVGKRLPSDAEWLKAGSWPVRISSTMRVQRKYPWGDSMDRSRANLWGSGPGHTVPVDQYPGGISVGGVHQLIGNVWEWTTSNFCGASLPPEDLPQLGLELTSPYKSIRGGAFDTYFDNQATCQFQSGENPLFRRNNIGLRCAVGVCDIMLVQPKKQEYKNTTVAVRMDENSEFQM